jgi:hypothetical protein
MRSEREGAALPRTIELIFDSSPTASISLLGYRPVQDRLRPATPRPGAAIANARSLFVASVLTYSAYEFVRVRSRRALVTACPYPSLLK